jgi:hypothetical protein
MEDENGNPIPGVHLPLHDSTPVVAGRDTTVGSTTMNTAGAYAFNKVLEEGDYTVVET